MAKPPRAYRVSEQIRTVIATELLKIGDPRLGLISVTSVTVSPDLREASIYWNIYGGQEKVVPAQHGLESVKGRMRSMLGKKMKIRYVPNIRFIYDNTLDTMEEVEKLISTFSKDNNEEDNTQEEE